MLPQLLLLLTVLGPGSSLQLRDAGRDGAGPAPGHTLLRERRQVDLDDIPSDDYFPEATDPPERLENFTMPVSLHLDPLSTTGQLELSPESGTVKATTRGSADQHAGGATVRLLSTELFTWQSTVEMVMATEPISTEVETTQPVATELETTPPATTPQSVPTEAETIPAADKEPETTPAAATEPETSPSTATEPGTTQFPGNAKARLLPEPVTTETPATASLSTVPGSRKFLPAEPTDSVILLGPSGTREGATMAASNLPDISMKKGQMVTPGSSMAPSSVAPSPSEDSNLIPVRQCLLAILILALLATIFLVCTVWLAVRLSRKSHMYPVRNYSPTEMVCISSLLPDGGDGGPVMTNGDLPKSQGLKAESGEERDGDDLTLRSFLP